MSKKKNNLATPESPEDEKVFSSIEEYGCQVTHVLEENDEPPFSFSIGLFHRFNHPEIILVGLKRELAHWMINAIRDEITKGKIFETDKMYSGFLEGFDVTFKMVASANYKEYLGSAIWFYQGYDFPILQCIYPTTKGYFPWDKKYPKDLIEWQRLLDK